MPLILAVGCSSNGNDPGSAGDTSSTGLQTDAEHAGGAQIKGSRAAIGGSSTELASNKSSGGTQARQESSFGQGGAATSMGGTSSLGGSETRVSNGGTRNESSRATRSSAGGKAPASGVPNGGAASGGKSVTGATSFGGATAGGKSGTSSGGSANGGNSLTGGAVGRGGASSSVAIGKGGATAGGGAKPIKVFIAGDSTVQNCSSSCPCGWGSQFDALFNSNVTVVNSAVGGRSIQTWLYDGNVSSAMGANGECTLTSTTYNARWTAMTNASTGMKAGDYLFIQFGINDGDSTCPRHVGSALYKTYLAEMAKAAKAAGAQPIYLTPASMIKCSGGTAVGSRGFLTETKEAGAANEVPVIDLHQLSFGLYNQLKLCPDSGDYTSTTSAVGKFFCADHTHFEAAGAAQIAKLVAQALKDQNIPLAEYLL
ncbi:MAG: GDSL-type esterase/lipase family protein [Myxococcales bacterium]